MQGLRSLLRVIPVGGQMASSWMDVIAQNIETGEVGGGLITFIVVNVAGRRWTASPSI